MDVVVLPTYREGFPTVPLEAAAMGLPVVATRVPGCVDAVVDGVTGVLVPLGDACSLAAALAAYIESAPLRASHGGAARERVKEIFQPSTMWALVLREYQHQLVRAGYSLKLHAPDSSKHSVASSLFAA
jgi:glycosyltransferase involved in cell wall biosynthesis